MNYSKFGMQTIYDKDFIKYLKDRNIEWEPIYNKLRMKVKNVILLACKDCPQMINYNSRAISAAAVAWRIVVSNIGILTSDCLISKPISVQPRTIPLAPDSCNQEMT